jgi:HlyD family secretion protein
VSFKSLIIPRFYFCLASAPSRAKCPIFTKSMPEKPSNSPAENQVRATDSAPQENLAQPSDLPTDSQFYQGPVTDAAGSLSINAPKTGTLDDPSKALTGELITSLNHNLTPVANPELAPVNNQELAPIKFSESVPTEEAWYQKKWIWALAAIGLLSVPAAYIYTNSTKPQPVIVKAPPPKIKAVSALGRLEPEGEVTKLTASSSQTALVRQVLVKEGDKVVPNQVVAILDTVATKQAQLSKANEDVKVAQANLDKVKAGAKKGEIAAQNLETLRIQQELQGDINTSKATRDRLIQQKLYETKANEDQVSELQNKLDGGEAPYQTDLNNKVLELRSATSEYKRYLEAKDAISASLLDSKRLAMEVARQNLARVKSERVQTVAVLKKQISSKQATKNQSSSTITQQIKEAEATINKSVATLKTQIEQSKANSDKVGEVRPVDIKAAEADITRAQAAVRQAQADLELSYVRSPIAGEVFKVQTKAGEAPSSKGILEIAQNDRMVAVAEIYESDIGKVKVGQTATIKSETGSFTGTIQGQVIQVGLQVAKKDVLNTDPAADADSRIVEVKIALDNSQIANIRGLTNSKVEVNIKTE